MWQLTPWLRLKAVWGGLAMQSDTQNAMQWQVTAKLTPTCHDRQSLRGNKTSGKALYLDHKGRLDMLRSVRTLFSCYCFSFVQRERESLRTKWGSWFVVVLQHSPTNMHEKSIREVFFFCFCFCFLLLKAVCKSHMLCFVTRISEFRKRRTELMPATIMSAPQGHQLSNMA